jgi:hypothetical protein
MRVSIVVVIVVSLPCPSLEQAFVDQSHRRRPRHLKNVRCLSTAELFGEERCLSRPGVAGCSLMPRRS